MRRIWLAIRVFFLVLFHREVAADVRSLLGAPEAAGPEGRQALAAPAAPARAARSEALTLLAALQREARFVDFIKEPLDAYSDAQIGAAVRDVHRDCAAVLERLFAIRPIVEQAEGSRVEVPAGFDAGCYRLTGTVAGEPPFAGSLVHHGWQATACNLPSYTGSPSAARVIAPAEVELS